MFNGELKQQTLLDDQGRPITDIEAMKLANDARRFARTPKSGK